MTKKKNILPTYECTLICDDVRQELHNKLSLSGLYADNIIINQPLPCVLPKLCFLTQVKGGSGEFAVTYTLIDPDGNNLLKDANQLKITPKQAEVGNIVVVVSPFRIEKEGEYTYSIFMDDEAYYSKKFVVSLSSEAKKE